MSRSLVGASLALGLAASCALSAPKRVSLANGKSIEGWEGDTTHTWRLFEGAFVGGSLAEMVPHNEFLCTRRSYTNFDLRLKCKLVGTGFVNGGVQFRSRRIENPAYEVSGYQADMGDGYWGGLYDESRRNRFLVEADHALIDRILKKNDWNDYEVRAEGRRIRLRLNGEQPVEYTETAAQLPQTGILGVQIHGGGKSEASYRDITFEELT